MQRFNFEQLVGEPTHIRGRLIDQIYVSKDFSVFSHLQASSSHKCIIQIMIQSKMCFLK